MARKLHDAVDRGLARSVKKAKKKQSKRRRIGGAGTALTAGAAVLGTPLLGLGTYSVLKTNKVNKAKSKVGYKLTAKRLAALKRAQKVSARMRKKKK